MKQLRDDADRVATLAETMGEARSRYTKAQKTEKDLKG